MINFSQIWIWQFARYLGSKATLLGLTLDMFFFLSLLALYSQLAYRVPYREHPFFKIAQVDEIKFITPRWSWTILNRGNIFFWISFILYNYFWNINCFTKLSMCERIRIGEIPLTLPIKFEPYVLSGFPSVVCQIWTCDLPRTGH